MHLMGHKCTELNTRLPEKLSEQSSCTADWVCKCFHESGGWLEKVVCPCLSPVELFDISHYHSESLEGQSWDNAGQDDGCSTLIVLTTKLFQMWQVHLDDH